MREEMGDAGSSQWIVAMAAGVALQHL